MTQLRNHWVTPEEMVRSRAWREGYESFRLRQAPEFGSHGNKSLAYEYGRLVAAFIRGQGHHLVRVQTQRPMYENLVPRFVKALEQVLDES